MIPPLISFELAKDHLNITTNDKDRDIDAKMRLASAIVANHCKLTDIPEDWIIEDLEDSDSADLVLVSDDDSSPSDEYYVRVPGNLQAAVLLVLSDLFELRESSTGNPMSDTVINLLAPFRDPTMA